MREFLICLKTYQSTKQVKEKRNPKLKEGNYLGCLLLRHPGHVPDEVHAPVDVPAVDVGLVERVNI